ncbi:MAG TPA: YCF48-related protein [Candidatus Binatia bacterium]|nr:YCF48-related protein [Candidatus Binatia bacterium]
MRLPLAVPLCLLAVTAPGSMRAAATPVPAGEIKQGLFATCFADQRAGWMVGELGRIFHTTDGGRSWERQEAGTKRPFLTVACVDARTAWIAGKEGIVYATADGGRTWTLRPTGSTRHLFGIRFAGRERGHAVGDYGTMIHTEDAGATWTVEPIADVVKLPDSAVDLGVDPGDVNLYAVAYGDAEHAWVVGEFGTIIATDDGGRSWRQQHAPVESTLFGVYFADARRGWAVGIDAVILRTEDGGETWLVQPPPIAQRSYYDVFVQGRTGWIVGDSGTMLASTDGGATWSSEPLPIQMAARWIRSVWLTPEGAGLAVGAEGLVLRLEDGRLAARSPS